MGMKILLLNPGQLISHFIGYYPRLGLRVLAALTPAEHQVTIIEGKDCDKIEFTDEWDLVGISALTPHVNNAYFIADRFRALGVPVVVGGVHPSGNPEEAKHHADAVCIGEGELVWPQILQDVRKCQLKPFYRADRLVDRATLVSPRRLPSDKHKYSSFPVETGRGCPINCAFCFVRVLFGERFQPRQIEHVVADIQEVLRLNAHSPEVQITFSENLLPHKIYARELFAALEGLDIQFGVEGRFEGLRDDDYLEAVRRAGCSNIYFETKMVSKRRQPRVYQMYADVVQFILDKGIDVSINFTVGYDDHDRSIYDDTWDFLLKNDFLRFSYVQLFVPWPGLPVFKQLEQQGRIINRNWGNYDNRHVVFRPKLMSPEELMRVHDEFWQMLTKRQREEGVWI